MTPSPHSTLMIACGALAKEVLAIKHALGLTDAVFDLQCLPASYHNFPNKIVPALEAVIAERGRDYDCILIGYGDCGTGGGLDRLLKKHPKAERLPGAHCYAFYAGLTEFDAMMEAELGTFFLTDYLTRHFKTLVVKGFGLDRYPDLRDQYFKHYKKLVYLSQTPTHELIQMGQDAADYLGLSYEHRNVGFGHLKSHIDRITQSGAAHV